MSKTSSQTSLRARSAQILALMGALFSADARSVRADEDGPRKALEALVPYDLEGSRTLDALTVLRDQAALKSDARQKRELNFVRAVALSDLWLIGQQSQNVNLLDGVAKAAGVARSEVEAVLTRSLADINDKVVADIVLDTRHALLATSQEQANAVELLKHPVGLRSEAVFVHAVSEALNKPDALEALSTLGSDPCAGNAACEPLVAPFDAQGRKAISALDNGLRALAHLRASLSHDPFVEAMSQRLEQDGAALAKADLKPSTRLQSAKSRAHATQLGSREAPDLVVLVSEGRAQLGFVPRVHVTSDGKVALHARGTPMLPATSEVNFSPTFPAFVKSVPELMAALTPLLSQAPDARVAIAAAPDAPAHLWARALLSAQAARFPHIAMLGVDGEGVMRSLEVEVVSSLRAAEVGPRDLNVVVRLGGFTVKQAGPTVTIPRVKKEDGFAFDFHTLLQNAKPANAKSAKLTFMSDVAADTLGETAFSVAPTAAALTVVLP